MPMRYFIITGAFLLGAAGVAQAGKQDFTLFNETGYQIDSVFVSAVNTKSWEEDVMGSESLASDESVNISFEKGARGCRYDLMVKYNDGDTAEWHNLNLCDISKVHLHWDKSAGTTTASTD